ncbi:hypothetical protein [Haloferax sp. YSMS24]|uniref:hypothetical protein n=1 Tax=Haloferax sp. YSMS24 TaxID=3388425 RepID=UPI00398CE4FD
MPTFPTSDLPVPESWAEFEAVVADVIERKWNDPYTTRNGRQGQAQNGVDIYGEPEHLDSGYAGVQCKNKTEVDIGIVEDEVEKAKDFVPELEEFIFACAAPSDAPLQQEVRELSNELTEEGLFSLRILFWDDLSLELSGDRELLSKHYPQFIEENDSLDSIKQKILESDASDWTYDDTEGRYTYEPDVNLRIERDDYEDHSDFHEDWAEFGCHIGRKFTVTIFYNSSPVEKEYIVSVDEYRSDIPMPDIQTRTITPYQYQLGKILNIATGYNYNDYLRRAGVTVQH